MVDYLSSQPNRAGYQVSTQQGSGPFFPVAYDDGFVWGVFEQKPNGSVICGMYDFQEKDYVEGPFKTFEEWVYSYG